MLVKDLMTTSPVCCTPDDTVDRVAGLMAAHDCGAIPVCENSKLVGIVTDRDITCRAIAAGKNPAEVPVRNVMTRTVYTIGPDEEIETAIDLMEEKMVRRLAVVDGDGLIGIIAPSDLAPTFASTNVADFLLAVSYWNRRGTAPAP